MADSINRPSHDVEMVVKVEATASAGAGSRKRRLSQNEIAGPSKRITTCPVSDIEEFNLLDFSDEVLLEVLLHCNSVSLQTLSK